MTNCGPVILLSSSVCFKIHCKMMMFLLKIILIYDEPPLSEGGRFIEVALLCLEIFISGMNN